MARIDSLDNFLTDVADSIRAKTGSSEPIPASEFDLEISALQSEPNLQDKEVTIKENTTTTIQADEGYDGLNQVSVVTDISTGGAVPEKGIIINVFDEEGYATDVSIVGLDTIPQYYFHNGYNGTAYGSVISTHVEKITLPDGVTEIGQSAFCQNKSLVNINLPNTIKTIGASAFLYDIQLSLETLPSELETINASAFSGCTNLPLRELPDGLTTIGASAFDNCKNTTIKKIPDGVALLSNYTFRNNTKLTQLSMNGVDTIIGGTSSNCCFNSCTGLIAVWIGGAITSSGFGRYAFYNCTNMIKMFINLPRATVENFSYYSYAFMNNSTRTGIIVCNDDDGFITQEEFDAIDWSTYTE